MHEARAVAAALTKVVARWPDDRKAGQLELEIRDATRAEAGSVAFYTAALLAERGLGEVTFKVRSHEIECALCGYLALPSPADPSCDQCGAPLPRRDGPAVVCEEVAPMCLMAPARVTAVDGDACDVEFGGRVVRASALLADDLCVGDWVLINWGTVVRKLDAEQAQGHE